MPSTGSVPRPVVVVDPYDFPAPCRCTDPKGHRVDCPSNPGEVDIVFARVERPEWYPGERFDEAMSWGFVARDSVA